MGSHTTEQVAHRASMPGLAHQQDPCTEAKAGLHKSVFLEVQGPNATVVLVEGWLHMVVHVQRDPKSETRLLATARTYIVVGDGSNTYGLASTVHFSIFSGKPSHCFPGDDTKWLQEWHTARLTDARLKDDGATREHVYAIRSLYKKDGALLDPGKKMLAGPHDSDTLIYISKIITEPKFAGKKLLKPMLDMLYSAVTHKRLAGLCQISGPVCWILEPGFINSDENDKMWPKLDGENDYARCDRVTRILKTKVYPSVGFTIYREDAKIPGQPDWSHTYMGRRVYAHPLQDGSCHCEIEPLPSEYPVPQPQASPAQNGKRKRSDALANSSKKPCLTSASRSPPKKKKKQRRSLATYTSSHTAGYQREQPLHSSITFTPISRPSQNSRASQQSQPQSRPGSSSSSKGTIIVAAASGTGQAQSSTRNRAELDDKDVKGDKIESDLSEVSDPPGLSDLDDDDEYHVDEDDDDDDDDEDDFVPGRSLARTVRRPVGQPTEGARPTRSTYILGSAIQ